MKENDKKKHKDASRFDDISKNLAAASFDSTANAGVGDKGSVSVSIGRFDDNQQTQNSPPGLSRSNRGGLGQLYEVPSPSRDANSGSLASWSSGGTSRGLPDLPPLPLPLPSMSESGAVFASNSESDERKAIVHRQDGTPRSKEPTPRSEKGVKSSQDGKQQQTQVLDLADLERNLFNITK